MAGGRGGAGVVGEGQEGRTPHTRAGRGSKAAWTAFQAMCPRLQIHAKVLCGPAACRRRAKGRPLAGLRRQESFSRR